MDRADRGVKLQRLRLAKAVDFTAFLLILQIYVHDLFFGLFLLTVFIHQCVTPLIPGWRLVIPRRSQQAVLLSMLVLRLCSILFHVFGDLPQPSFDGRSHGWLFVEFIGETPVSRIWLVVWDTMLLGLQIAGFLITFPVPRDPSQETLTPVAELAERVPYVNPDEPVVDNVQILRDTGPTEEELVGAGVTTPEEADLSDPTGPSDPSEPSNETELIGPTKVTMKELQSGHAIIYTLDVYAIYNLWQLRDPPSQEDVLPLEVPLVASV